VANRTGVLVIRAWLEDDVEHEALRARIKQTLDVSRPVTTEVVARSEEEILAAVSTWLHAFAGGSDAQD
jgi:hypothetical protein